MSPRFDRFRNLEKRRQKGPAGAAPTPSDRFEAVEKPGNAPRAALPEAAADRFRAPRERTPEIAERVEGEQPFVRCARCEADNTVYAATCINCQSDLGTPEQRAYNERLWAARREEAAREAEELEARQRERERLAVEEEKARYALAAEMAREVGQRERRRLDGEGIGSVEWGGWGWRRFGRGRLSWSGGTPLAILLLRRIRDPWLRGAAAVLPLAVPGMLALFGRGAVQGVGAILLLVAAGLYVLPGARPTR